MTSTPSSFISVIPSFAERPAPGNDTAAGRTLLVVFQFMNFTLEAHSPLMLVRGRPRHVGVALAAAWLLGRRAKLRPLLGVECALEQRAEDRRFDLGPDVLGRFVQFADLFLPQRDGGALGKFRGFDELDEAPDLLIRERHL